VKQLIATAMAATAIGLGQQAQTPEIPRIRLDQNYEGAVISGKAVPGELPLSLADAIARGLKNNLGSLLSNQDTRSAQAAKWRALSNLLPNLTTRTSATEQQVNLAAFGFSGFPGIPAVLGPFSIYDARAFLSQPVIDFTAVNNSRAGSQNIKAANFSYQNARDTVVLAVANLYLQAIAGESRITSAQAQVNTADALYKQAVDFKNAGIVPAIEVLRSQVELQSQQQRLIFYRNEYEKQKLDLARAIGLPPEQVFRLNDALPYAPAPPVSLDEALQKAYASRADYQSAAARVRAAELTKKAAEQERLPSLALNADYGTIGQRIDSTHGTFSVAGTLRIPIFQGGRVRADVLQADADLERERAQLEELRGRIDFDLRKAFLDVKSTSDRIQVARTALQLAEQQVSQARDRFAAGVASNIEVVQAQEALASADENSIASLYAFNIAKALLARNLGAVEKSFQQFLLGVKP